MVTQVEQLMVDRERFCLKHGAIKSRRVDRKTFRYVWICVACMVERIVDRDIDDAVARGCIDAGLA
jgi:hypothetical protein